MVRGSELTANSSGRMVDQAEALTGGEPKEKSLRVGMMPRTKALTLGSQPMAKSTSRVVTQKPARVKTAVVISPEAFKRLGACCLSENMTQSEVVELLINRALSGYVLAVRGAGLNPGASIDRPNLDDHGRENVPAAA